MFGRCSVGFWKVFGKLFCVFVKCLGGFWAFFLRFWEVFGRFLVLPSKASQKHTET